MSFVESDEIQHVLNTYCKAKQITFGFVNLIFWIEGEIDRPSLETDETP